MATVEAWLRAGVALAAGSDAPYGQADPWRAMRAAVDRRTAAGRSISPEECLEPEEALALFSSNTGQLPADAGGISSGRKADLIVLDRSWREARRVLTSDAVEHTLAGGQVVYSRG